MIDIDWKPSPRKLRQFAAASLVGFPLIGLLLTKLLPLAKVTPPDNLITIGAIIGVIVCVLGLLIPRAVTPVYLALVILFFPVGFVLGWVLLPAIYYLVFTPIGLGLRLLGKDPMERRWGQDSYWSERKPMPAPATYYRQY